MGDRCIAELPLGSLVPEFAYALCLGGFANGLFPALKQQANDHARTTFSHAPLATLKKKEKKIFIIS